MDATQEQVALAALRAAYLFATHNGADQQLIDQIAFAIDGLVDIIYPN